MKKTFWNKLTARGTRGKTRCAAAVLALAMTFSMGAPLALAAVLFGALTHLGGHSRKKVPRQ